MSTPVAERQPADPRPRVARVAEDVTLTGWRCRSCGHPVTQPVLACPMCRGEVAEETFATQGEVWASTCLRVRVPGHEPPFAVAYVVLDDDGPRILVHTPGDQPLPPGSRARVVDVSADGDPIATAIDEHDEETR